ncbi:ankyrin [Gonapodya prolifera JEL478]|uniref:Ankyrin n=1 Tax=Gonapodya prolifera (strain JEL478) TaxID=1344416 RepID=A0A139AKR3_GONPJ|nr:ankyrin [Gonapodya prolifera JEL478]|eukprot:KXS17360.1 ankyrin [Gonapodya prolifera JEL478]
MKTLLAASVDPNNATEDGKTALKQSALHESLDIIEVLLAHGADVNHQDAFGRTALIFAVCPLAPYQYRRRITSFDGPPLWNAHIVQTLLCVGADPALCNALGQTALMLACMHHSVHTLDRLLAETSPQVLNARDATGSTALMFVLRRGPIVVEHLERLLSAGADPDGPDKSAATPLLLATLCTSLMAISTVLDYGAYPSPRGPYAIDAIDAQGRTALIAAFDSKCERCVSELISAGADVFVGWGDVDTEGN